MIDRALDDSKRSSGLCVLRPGSESFGCVAAEYYMQRSFKCSAFPVHFGVCVSVPSVVSFIVMRDYAPEEI